MHAIQFPDELYARLAAYAAQHGQTPEETLIDLATQVIETSNDLADEEATVPGYDPATDPLARFAGMYVSNDPGWIERHDQYFGGGH